MRNIYEGGNPNKPQLKDGKRVKLNSVDNTGYQIKNEHKENGTATIPLSSSIPSAVNRHCAAARTRRFITSMNPPRTFEEVGPC